MSGALVDTNVLLDVVTGGVQWSRWLQEQLDAAAGCGAVYINPIIYAKLAPAFTADDLDQWLDRAAFDRVALPYAAAWLAAQAFIKYRKSGGTRTAPLPDFFIGAHAQTENLTLITQDAGRYQTYFPSISLIAPT